MNAFWQNRIKKANDAYKNWSIQFKCDILEDYYEGRQWRFNSFFTSDPYTVNLVYSTIKIKAANILLSYPEFVLAPKPGNSDYNQEMAMQSAALKQDVLNTLIDDEKEAFTNACHLCFLDSMFRFGIMEVGYAADWLRNPMAQAPLLSSQETTVGEDTEEFNGDKVKIAQMPEELPQNEKIFFKRIQASRFRVGTLNAQELDRCDWVGYYEFVRLEDLKVIKGLKSDYLDSMAVTYSETGDVQKSSVLLGSTEGDEKRIAGMTKIWHTWDLRAKKRYLILDSPCDVMWEDDFKRLPIKDIRWDLRVKGWYPIPPVYHWLSPQNEYNESREMMRSHRKRFVRKFQAVGDDIDQEEIDKFTNGEDGTIIKLPRTDAIKAIEDPQLSNGVKEALIISKDDFNEVSGTSSADRGRADRTTATESQRLGLKADVRDSAESDSMKKFYVKLGREALMLMKERFVEGTWAKLSQDPGEDFLGQIQDNPAYQWVTSEKLDDGYDFKIAVEVVSASPLMNEDEKKKFVEFLSLLNNFPQIAMSPKLVREAAYRCGYRNERVIQEAQKMAQLTMLGAVQQAQQNAGGGAASGAPQQITQQMTPPTQEQVTNQIKGQLVQ